MSEALTITSLKTIFRFPFRGEQERNRFLVGVGITCANLLVPVLPWFLVMGYTLRVMRRAIQGEEPEMLAWEDWGGLLKDGLRRWVVSLVYLLPGMLVLLGGILAYFAAVLAFPVIVGIASARNGRYLAALPLLFMVGMLFLFFSMIFGPLLVILGAIPLPVATAHFVAEGKLSSAFRVGAYFRLLWANKLGYLSAFVIVAGLFSVAYVVAMLASYTFILMPFAYLLALPFSFYLSLVSAVLFGQAYRESVAIAGGMAQA